MGSLRSRINQAKAEKLRKAREQELFGSDEQMIKHVRNILNDDIWTVSNMKQAEIEKIKKKQAGSDYYKDGDFYVKGIFNDIEMKSYWRSLSIVVKAFKKQFKAANNGFIVKFK